MNHSINKLTNVSASAITLATIFLFPLFFLPTTSNFFETNKIMLLILATGLLMLVWAVNSIITRSIKLSLTPFSVPLLAYGLMHFISSFVANPQSPVDALMNRGGLFLALGLFVTLSSTLIDNRRFIRHAIYTLIGSGTVLAIISVFQSFGFGLSNLVNKLAGTTIPNSLAFTPAGSPVALMTFLAPVILLALFLAFTKTETAEKISLFVLSAIMSSAFVVMMIYSFPGKDTSPVFLPFQTGYAIAIESLKAPKTALLGIGTNSFTVAYNMLRPATMNQSSFWNVRFSVSTNEILQILTTVGVIGLGLFFLIISRMVKVAKADVRSTQVRALKVTAFGLLLLFFLIPGTFLLFFAFYLILLLWGMQLKFASHDSVKNIELSLSESDTKPQTIKLVAIYAPALIVIVAAAASLYMGGRAYAAEMTFKRALDAAVKNDGVKTYDLQRQAILENPYSPQFRRAYATTNLALANALAGNKDITDEDKNNITQLIQQSIREGKIAVSLEPANAVNWENLTLIYRSLINAAEGADQWTVAALSQAIQTDPVNPSLRVDLGGVYYSLGGYDQAIRLFQQAAELKPDYANAYYNLSHSYQQKKDPIAAYDYMKQTLTLIPADSADYTKAKAELEELSKALPKQDQAQAQAETEQTAPAKTNLQVPSPAPSPATTVDLPQGSGPENAAEVQP
jgi:tetratricopeptide (TPR) repeat protein